MPKLPNPAGRSTEEWIGRTPDSRIPRHVRVRIFDRANGICHLSGRKITSADQWDLEHVLALKDGGENRESNLRPAIRDKHLEKTISENSERAVVNRLRAAALGAEKPNKAKIAQPKKPPKSSYKTDRIRELREAQFARQEVE